MDCIDSIKFHESSCWTSHWMYTKKSTHPLSYLLHSLTVSQGFAKAHPNTHTEGEGREYILDGLPVHHRTHTIHSHIWDNIKSQIDLNIHVFGLWKEARENPHRQKANMTPSRSVALGVTWDFNRGLSCCLLLFSTTSWVFPQTFLK